MKNIKSFNNFLNERLYDFSHPDVKDKWALRVPNELPQKFDDMKCIDNTGFEDSLVVGATYKNLGYSSMGDKVFIMDDNKEYNHVPLKCFWNEVNEAESVRDLMKPKSTAELKKIFDNLTENELAIKELQGMQSIMLADSLTNLKNNKEAYNREVYNNTDIDCHKLFQEGRYRLFYISTGEKSIEFGIPPRIESIFITNSRENYYVDVDNKFVGRDKNFITEIITTFQNEYRDKVQGWNDITMEDGIDSGPSNITSDKVFKWFTLLQEMFEGAHKHNNKVIKEGEQIPELRYK